VRAGQNEQDNTVFGGHSKPVPMSEVKTQKTKAEAKGKWKISNQRRPVELLDEEYTTRRAKPKAGRSPRIVLQSLSSF